MSQRLLRFQGIQLNIKGKKTIEESFTDYIQTETLDGDKRYLKVQGILNVPNRSKVSKIVLKDPRYPKCIYLSKASKGT